MYILEFINNSLFVVQVAIPIENGYKVNHYFP